MVSASFCIHGFSLRARAPLSRMVAPYGDVEQVKITLFLRISMFSLQNVFLLRFLFSNPSLLLSSLSGQLCSIYAVMPREEFCANADDARTVYFIVGKAVGALRASASSSLQRLVIVLTSK